LAAAPPTARKPILEGARYMQHLADPLHPRRKRVPTTAFWRYCVTKSKRDRPDNKKAARIT
jgi:hypothetical protein